MSQKHTKLIRYLGNLDRYSNPSTKTIAEKFKTSESDITTLIQEINHAGMFQIDSGKGGGKSIVDKTPLEKDIYQHIEPHLGEWLEQNIFGTRGLPTKKLLTATHKQKLDGKWSTPDFTLLSMHSFLHSPQKLMELLSVEVKHASKDFNVSCVYEALAHTRVATYGILFFYENPIATIADERKNKILEEIQVECVRLGIGLVISDYPCDSKTWRYLIPARKHYPDFHRVDDFIEAAFTSEEKHEFKRIM